MECPASGGAFHPFETGYSGDSSLKEGEESYRTARPPTLAAFPPWGDSEGAGRMTLTGGKGNKILKLIFVIGPVFISG